MSKKKFKVIRISGIATGVGYSEKMLGGIFGEEICETLFDTGNDKRDAADSEKWAKIICKALNKFYNP